MPKCCIFSSIFNIKRTTQKFTNFDNFFMHADMEAVTIQFNKIVLNEVKDNEALPEPSYRKKKIEVFGQPSIKTP